jgi:Derlin-2/3
MQFMFSIFMLYVSWLLVSDIFQFESRNIRIYDLLFRVQYGRALEANHFPGPAGRAEMSFMMFFGAALMWLVSFVLGLPFMATSMQFYMMYIWSRKNPQQPVSLWGFGLKGWQLPFGMMVLGLLMGGSPLLDLVGIVCGHVFHFLADIVPLAYGRQVLTCPQFVYGMFDQTARRAAPAWGGQGHRLN